MDSTDTVTDRRAGSTDAGPPSHDHDGGPPTDAANAGDGFVPRPLPFPVREDSPERVVDELISTIVTAINAHPRSLQEQVGPSEIGTPCERKLGHKLLLTPQRPQPVPWKPSVGTAMHTWMETVFGAANRAQADNLQGHDRYYIEPELTVGTVAGRTITGHSDLYDRLTATNWDWKFPGPSKLRMVRRNNHPGDTYRTQAHLYGLGWENVGLPVRHCGIVFLPRDGEFDDRFSWSEPYDRQVALDALVRLGAIATLTDRLGTTALDVLNRVDDYCEWCPFYAPRIDSSEGGCPGPDGGTRRYRRQARFTGSDESDIRVEDLI